MPLLSNPVLMKELRGRMRGNRSLVILTLYLALTGAITLLVYLAFASSTSGGPDLEEGRTIGKAIFLTVMISALIQVCIITPSLTAGSIAGEKERQSYDLLITTLLSPWQIIVGKLGAAIAFATLLIIAVLPMAGLAFLFGGVSGAELATAMVILLVTALLYASVGMFWSAVARTTLGATVRSQATIMLLLLSVPFLFVILVFMEVNEVFLPPDLMEDLANMPLFIYLMGAFLCSHPFVALGLTEASLSAGENPFLFTIDPGRGDILVLSPWLAYLFIGLLMTFTLLFLSMRMLRPVQYRVPRGERKKG